MTRTALLSILLLTACGALDRTTPTAGAPDAGDGAGGEGVEEQGFVGTVWAPGNAPGMVPPGHEIPVSGAMVYLGNDKPEPIEQSAQCTPCVEAPPGAVITDAKGNFELHPPPGTHWLIVQKAQFRLEQQIVVGEGWQAAPAEMTTLPSVHDPDNGKWIPRIALAAGDYDAMESILGKMGIGSVGGDGSFLPSSATGRFDVYANGGWDLEEVAVGTLTDLVTDLEKMLTYHIIFIPCAADENTEALQTPAVLRNIRDYVAAGGRLYVTDWSGEWADNVFPGEITLAGGDYDTPATAYDREGDTWNAAQFGTADGDPDYSSPDGEATDPDLAAWLDGQTGPDSYPIDANNFHVEGNWNHITKLDSVQVGETEGGEPVLDEPRAYVIGSDGEPGGKKALTATFEPAGCGRVLYSTYHTTEEVHVGLAPQERVLLYLLMEIGVCKDVPDVD